MKRAVLIGVLVLSFGRSAYAVCAPGSDWTAAWTDSFGQTTYTLVAPCKVYIGIPFNITATVTDATYPNSDVGFGWAIKDNGAVILGGGFNWITTASGQWQQVIQQTYTGTPIDHLLEFKFTDLGAGMNAHWWGSELIGDVTVDPFPNTPPVVDAGPNVFISGKDQNAAVIRGSASDADGNPLTYRWREGATELKPSSAVDASGSAPLDLGTIPRMSLGSHTFTLEVSDGTATASDTVIVSVENTQPVAAPFTGGTYQAGDPVTLGGSVSDYDGDRLSYQWMEGSNVLTAGSVAAISGGAPVQLPAYVLTGGLPVGTHLFVLQLSDGINAISASTIVHIIDTQAPTLAPTLSRSILWPPNGKMTEVQVKANARDNGGGPVTVGVLVKTNVAARKDHRKDALPDYSITRIDQSSGLVVLQLRNARGRGEEPVYTIVVTAEDASGNTSTADVVVRTAGDMGRQ